VEKLKNELQARTARRSTHIEEVIHPELDARSSPENVALQLQKRVRFRRAMKKAVTSACASAPRHPDRLRGPAGRQRNRAREWYRDGRVPLHTIRADIDYGLATAHTTAGTIA